MATIITRAGKGTALTYNEVDSNFTNLNNEKLDTVAGGTVSAPTVFSVNSASDALRVTQEGAGLAIRVEDSANPDATPFVVTGSGLVGIGTASPNTNLQVIGQAFFGLDSNRVRLNSSAATGIIEFNSTEGKISNNQAGGVLTFAPSGGTEQVRIDSSGNVGIGTTSPLGRVHLSSSSSTVQYIDSYATTPDPAIVFRTARGTSAAPTATQSGDSIGFIGARGYGATGFAAGSRAYMAFLAAENWTDSAQGTVAVFRTTATGTTTTSERLRIDSAGNVGIGTTTTTGYSVRIGKNLTGAATSVGVQVNGSIQTDVTAGFYSYDSRPSIVATAVVPLLYHFLATQGTYTGSVTNQYGFVTTDLAGATGSNIGFLGQLSAGTNKFNLYMSGTAVNYLAGNLGVGNSSPNAKLDASETNAGGVSVLARFRNGGTTIGTASAISFMTSTNSGTSQSMAAIYGVATSTGGSGDLYFGTSLNNSMLERMRIDSSGNVGIGGTPTTKLEVFGTTGNIQLASTGNRITYTRNAANYLTASGASAVIAYECDNHQFYNGAGTTERLRIDSAGLVGINTTSPASTNGGLDIASGGLSLVLGADASAITRTNATEKQARIAGYHYTNAEEPVGGMVVTSAVSSSTVFIGGGSSQTNAATSVQFYTAANTTTTTGTLRGNFTTGGKFLLGGTVTDYTTASVNARFQLTGNDANSGSASISRYSADTSPPYLVLAKSRSGTVGTMTAVASNDELGRIEFAGADGTDLGQSGAFISAFVDGTVANNSIPGRLSFWTTEVAGTSPTERFRIDSAGNIAQGGLTSASTHFRLNKSVSTGNDYILRIDNSTAITAAGASINGVSTNFLGLTGANPSAVIHFEAGQFSGVSAQTGIHTGFLVSGSGVTGATNIAFQSSYNGAGNWQLRLIGDSKSLIYGNLGVGNVGTYNSTVTVEGCLALKAPTQVNAATYTVLDVDSSLIFHTTACTVTLPAAATYPGRILYMKNRSAIAITSNASNVKPLATDTAGTAILAATAGKFAMLQSDGTNWVVMMAN